MNCAEVSPFPEVFLSHGNMSRMYIAFYLPEQSSRFAIGYMLITLYHGTFNISYGILAVGYANASTLNKTILQQISALCHAIVTPNHLFITAHTKTFFT